MRLRTRCLLAALVALAAPLAHASETAITPSLARGPRLDPIGDFDALFQKHGAEHQVDWRLMKAIGIVESHLNPRAENPDGLSAGIMQLHCAPAFTPSCRNRLNIPNWPPTARARLYEPDYNISIGTQVIAWNIRRYGLTRGIAAYNNWSARHTPRDRLFPNQFYVDKVLLAYRRLQTTPAGGGANNTGSTGRNGLPDPPFSAVTAPHGPRKGL